MNTPVTCIDASSTTGFPGFGEGAPLDLSGVNGPQLRGIVSRFQDGSVSEFTDLAAQVNNCVRPIRLTGTSYAVDKVTGELTPTFSTDDLPSGVLYRPCGNRRAEVCPSCSRTYAHDTYAMIRSGVMGGKTIPATVAENPLLFVTLTAPSFGHVHGPRCGKRRASDAVRTCAHGGRLGCSLRHADDDERLGAPLCFQCYDWASAVIWQWWAPELWRRTTIALRRNIAKALNHPEYRLKEVASLQFAKVAEFQARGLVHFHALIRLDGPGGPGSPAPLDGDQLRGIVRAAAESVSFEAPPVDRLDQTRCLRWGRQLDVRVVRQGIRTDDPEEPLTPDQVAGYLAKYATKDAGTLRGVEPRAHLSQLRAVTRALANRARKYDRDAEAPYALLKKWSHMYGFRGHFSSKSRRYSVTLGQLRRARRRYAQMRANGEHPERLDTAELEARLLSQDGDEETTLVVGSWTYRGSGWPRPGDEQLALAAAARAREYDRWKADQKQNNYSGNR